MNTTSNKPSFRVKKHESSRLNGMTHIKQENPATFLHLKRKIKAFQYYYSAAGTSFVNLENFLLNLSIRPAVSINFTFPVKNG
jgi:hypothetical protein